MFASSACVCNGKQGTVAPFMEIDQIKFGDQSFKTQVAHGSSSLSRRAPVCRSGTINRPDLEWQSCILCSSTVRLCSCGSCHLSTVLRSLSAENSSKLSCGSSAGLMMYPSNLFTSSRKVGSSLSGDARRLVVAALPLLPHSCRLLKASSILDGLQQRGVGCDGRQIQVP